MHFNGVAQCLSDFLLGVAMARGIRRYRFTLVLGVLLQGHQDFASAGVLIQLLLPSASQINGGRFSPLLKSTLGRPNTGRSIGITQQQRLNP